MRFFVGTLLGFPTQLFYDRFIDDVIRAHPDSLRRIPERSAHLTYAFVADAGGDTVDVFRDALTQATRGVRPFEIRLGPPRVIAAGSRPRLVCADIVSGETELLRLAAGLLTSLRLACPDLPMSPSRAPHVTLARFRKQARRSDGLAVSRSLPTGPEAARGPVEQIAHVQIVRSSLTPNGPVYEVLDQVPLPTPDSRQT